jgi:hypothetical protein
VRTREGGAELTPHEQRISTHSRGVDQEGCVCVSVSVSVSVCVCVCRTKQRVCAYNIGVTG